MDTRPEGGGALARLRQILWNLWKRREPAPPTRAMSPNTPRPVERPQVPAVRRNADEFLALIEGLVQRPRRFDRGLPLIWLTGNKDSVKVLDALVDRITAPTIRYRVPFTRLQASRGIPKPQGVTQSAHRPDIRPLLHAACMDLSRQRFGGERLRFRHYALVEWLMSQDLSPLALDDAPDRLEKLLRNRHRRRDVQSTDVEAAAQASDIYQWLILTLSRMVPGLLFRTAVSRRRLPLLGRRYRWLMRQQYLAPQQSGSFVGFAERLTEGVWQFENPVQVNKLLVHAFLQDLRLAYTRRPWRWWAEGWRRTAYPLMLIEDVDHGTDGCLLLQLINSVRNETGRGDPLLAICTSNDGPPPTDTNGHRLIELPTSELPADERWLRERDSAYKKWAEALPQSRRARMRTAWNFPVVVPDANLAKHIGGRPITPLKPPWFARRAVLVALVVTLIVSVAGWVGWESGGIGCTHRPFLGDIAIRNINGQCIGYSDNDGFRFNDEPSQGPLHAALNKIFEQNGDVREEWGNSNQRRPLVTIVYLGSLTGRDTGKDEEAYAAEREELEGLAVAQRQSLDEPASSDLPLLRIVVANGGGNMQYATQAVAMIAKLARRDPTVVAVVGLVDSRANTAKALQELNRAGLLAIATTLSADGFSSNSRLYLQLAPPNEKQASMLHEYATKELKVAEARVYYTFYRDDASELKDDRYVATLVDGIQQEFDENGTKIEVKEFQFAPLTGECGYSGMLLFAGRWSDFEEFVGQLGACGDNPPEHLVANDSVNRYMANKKLRGPAPSNLSLDFVSKAQLGACEWLWSASAEGDSQRSKFLDLIKETALLSPPRCRDDEPNSRVGERVPLAYDAAMLVMQAVERLAERLHAGEQVWNPRPINSVTVHAEILGEHRSNAFLGVTGRILFDATNGEPLKKRISILHVDSIPDPNARFTEVFHCGVHRADDDASCREP